MRSWIIPAIVAAIVVAVVEQFGWQEQAWWLVPAFLFPVAVTLMIVRKELSVRTVAMLVLLSGVLALVLKLTFGLENTWQ